MKGLAIEQFSFQENLAPYFVSPASKIPLDGRISFLPFALDPMVVWAVS